MQASSLEQRFPALADDIALLESRFAQQRIGIPAGQVSYRECGAGPVVVLLHGIGSASASWLPTAMQLAPHMRVIAWDAPGYGESTALEPEACAAQDYAHRLRDMLDALGIERFTLVGHSLGAIMAAAFVASCEPSARPRTLLLSPTQGYGAPERAEQARKVFEGRRNALADFGVGGVAERRAPHMVSASATARARAWVEWNMSRLSPEGYMHAVKMLTGDDMLRYPINGAHLEVHSGADDTITTPESCQALAQRLEVPYTGIDGAGHACYVDRPEAVASLIRRFGTASSAP